VFPEVGKIMKAICGFKTTDGEFWETEAEASKHQFKIDQQKKAFDDKVEAVRRLVVSREYHASFKRIFFDLKSEEVAKMIKVDEPYSGLEYYSRFMGQSARDNGFNSNEFRVVKECQKIVETLLKYKHDLNLIKDLL
jgi:hypothetical protein